MDFFATAAKGTEGALRDELRELRFRGVRADRGGVHFAGEWIDGLRACLWSRIAVRILAPLAKFVAPDGRALYEGVRAIDWTPYLSARHTLAVRATGRTDGLTHTQFVAQKTKDAIVDQLRDRTGARPSVDLERADVDVFVHLAKESAEVYLDLAGDSLHKRGFRTRIGEAPLKETLAAAIVRLSGWDRTVPLFDPMCGSGTIAIEASMLARNIAPGLARDRFGFERWAMFDDALADRARDLREAARAAGRAESPPVFASDLDPAMLDIARANANAAGVRLSLRREDVRSCEGTSPPGVVVTNPPYGERLEGGPAFYREMAAALSKMAGHTVGILAGTPEIERAMRRKPTKWIALFNGPIECRYYVYDMA